MLTMSVAFSVSSASAGFLLESEVLTLKTGFLSFSILMMLSGMIFTLWSPREKVAKDNPRTS
jgi:hypothetical protein